MKVKLMVDWDRKEILTVKELNKRIDDRFDEVMEDADAYNEYLDDYLDSNYTKMELFKALTGDKVDIEEVIGDVCSGVSEAIFDYVNMDISSDYAEVTIEV
jgi:hypothetical protein